MVKYGCMNSLTINDINLFSRESLSVLGDILGIISFVLTVFVLYDTRKIRGYYKFKGRGPALLKDLSKYSLSISRYFNDFENFLPQIAEELKRSEAKLKSLEKKLSGQPKASVKQLRKIIDECEVSTENERGVRAAHLEMVKVIEEVKEHRKDLDWEI
ncbi:MAG TPA: hypothetical protein VF791_19235 [Pyrinomonadaceae bacterium]